MKDIGGGLEISQGGFGVCGGGFGILEGGFGVSGGVFWGFWRGLRVCLSGCVSERAVLPDGLDQLASLSILPIVL